MQIWRMAARGFALERVLLRQSTRGARKSEV
jgi:hypothetical protein